MNLVNLPVSILFFAVIYLVAIYGLLAVAQMIKPSKHPLISNPEESGNQIEVP